MFKGLGFSKSEQCREMQDRLALLENTVSKVIPELQKRLEQAANEDATFRKDVLRRLETVETDIRNTHPVLHAQAKELAARLQTLENEIQNSHPDFQFRIQDLSRRMQSVEDDIRSSHPDFDTRLEYIERQHHWDKEKIRARKLTIHREVSAERLPAKCSCKRILGKTISAKGKPRILVDVSQLLIVNARSGIQRVVIRVLDAMLANNACTYVPVGLFEGKVHYVEYHQDESAFYIGEPLKVMPSDTLLMLDSSWEFYSFFESTFKAIRAAKGKIYIIVYDLIPLVQSQYVHSGLLPVFVNWIKTAIGLADGMLCISKTVAEQLRNYIVQNHIEHKISPLKIGHFVLGADFIDPVGKTDDPEISKILEKVKDKKKFLSVSTVEPRKNYNFMLDVMEKLWARGYDIAYFIVGKPGWNVDDQIARIRNHPELNKRLFWFQHLDDKALLQLYKASDVLLNLSHGEGYGLSLVEGAHYKCAVVASDIPVFHEVITDNTTLFCSPDSLTDTVDAIAKRLARNDFVPSQAKYYMWADALRDLVGAMCHDKWDFKV